jgi:ComF family protein
MNVFDRIVGVIAPHECLKCGIEGSVLCVACMSQLTPIPPRCYKCHKLTANFKTCRPCRSKTPIYSVTGLTTYDGVAKDLIHALKFSRTQAAAGDISQRLAIIHSKADYDTVSYVPTANSRVRSRGYDQAYLIAKELARKRSLPCQALLLRTGEGRQVGQSRQMRHTQMLSAFKANNQEKFRNKHVLLIDDVITTGATCEAAARVLIDAGARRVSVVVFAVA